MMDPTQESRLQDRLSRIATEWTAIRNAQGDDPSARRSALEQLIDRYQTGAYRYLLAASGDPGLAHEVWQEFALQFCRGSFKTATPEKGRFRDFLKRVLVNLLKDQWRAQDRLNRQSALTDRNNSEPSLDLEVEFFEAWREELIDRAWSLLKSDGDTRGHVYYQILRWRAENANATSAEMAAALTELLRPETPFSDASIRQGLKRSRERFGDLLIEELAISIQSTERDAIEDELVALKLLPHCRSAFERYQMR